VPEHESSEDAGRARAFWSGLLSFGLVSIPVELLPAHRSHAGGLRMLDADGTPLARRYYCPADDEDVPAEHLVHGYELKNGRVVVVTDEELEALAPKKSREIDLRLFVDRDSIPPLYFARSYFLAPGADSGKAYRLLCAVMERSRRAGVATFVMRDREYLIAIFAEGGLLRGQTLRFHGEVRSSSDVGLPKPVAPPPLRVKQLSAAVAALETDRWVTSDLTDAHADSLHELARKKYRRRAGVVTTDAGSSHEGAEIIDLMEVLKKSLTLSGMTPKPAKSTRSATKSAPVPRATRAKKTAPRKATRGTKVQHGRRGRRLAKAAGSR
jgi:DNA end-binding protein Ku